MVEQLNLFSTTNCDYEEEQREKKIERESELTPRQWAVYRLIYQNSMVFHRKTTQREIFEKVSGYEWNDDEKCHDHCTAIWTDITKNNLSFSHDKIIISKNFEYWIGDKNETNAFLTELWNQLAPRLMRYWFYKAKLKRDGQGKLLSNQLDVIDENSKAREFIESYNPYNIS